MSVLLIGDNEYKIPEELTLGKWIMLSKIGIDNPRRFVAYAFDLPLDKADLLEDRHLELAGAFIMQLMFPNTTSKLKLKDFNKFNLGNFIDCEVMMDGGNDKMIELCDLIYEEKITKDTPISQVYAGYNAYIKYRNMLYFNYKELFGIDDEPNEVVEVQQYNKVDNAHMWYDLVMILADSKFLNINQVVSRPVAECFNFLAWNKDKQRQKMQQIREQQLKAKMK